MKSFPADMSIVAIIPARQGSKGIKDKNIHELSGHPLISYSVIAALLVPSIERVIVSTDSSEYAEISNLYGAETPFLRPSNISKDDSKDIDFMAHAMKWFDKEENYCPEYWVHLRPTTPLREPEIIEDAIQKILTNDLASSLRSAHVAPESPFKWYIKDKKGYFENLNASKDELDHLNNPRQKFPEVHIPNGYVDVIRRSTVIEKNLLHGNKILAYQSPYCLEVDSAEEMSMLEFSTQNKESQLLKFLNKIKN